MSGSKRVPHCVLQTSWTLSEADLKERVDKNENKAKPVQLLLHLTTQVILKLKIVFNLCLCSFFKRTRNRATKTSIATIPKMRILTTCVSVCFSSCTTNAHRAPLLSGQVTTRESLCNHKGGFIYVPLFLPHTASLQELHGLQVQDVGMLLVHLLPAGNTRGVAVTCVVVSCVSGAVNSHPPVLYPSFSSPGIKLAMFLSILFHFCHCECWAAPQPGSKAPPDPSPSIQQFVRQFRRWFWHTSLVMVFDPGHDDPDHGSCSNLSELEHILLLSAFNFILTASHNCCSHFPVTTFKIEKNKIKKPCLLRTGKVSESKFRILTAELTTCACSGNQRILWQRFPGRFQRDSEDPFSQTWNKVTKKRSQSGLMCLEGSSPQCQICECGVWSQQAVEQGPAEVMCSRWSFTFIPTWVSMRELSIAGSVPLRMCLAVGHLPGAPEGHPEGHSSASHLPRGTGELPTAWEQSWAVCCCSQLIQ